MPEVFEHAFALLGERIEDHVDLERLDPAYRLFPEPVDGGPAEPFDVVGDAEANWETFDALEPGAGDAMRRYAEDVDAGVPDALDQFLYTTFARPGPAADRRRRCGSSRHAGRPAHRHARRQGRGDRDRPGAAAGARLPRGVPRVVAVPGARAVLADEPPRPRRRRTFPARRDVHDHRGARAAGAARRASTSGPASTVASIEVDDDGPSVRHPRRSGTARGVRLADGSWSPPTSSSPPRTGTTPRPRCSARAQRPARGRPGRTAGPGISALLIMAGVRGELPELAHHSLFFTRDWPTNFEDILGTGRVDRAGRTARARGRVAVRLADHRHRPDRRARRATRTSSCWSRSPPTRRSARGPGARGARGPVPRPDRRLGGHPRPARARGHPSGASGPRDFARDFSAWRGTRAGHGAHAAAERDVPPGRRVRARPQPAARRAVARSPVWDCRCA